MTLDSSKLADLLAARRLAKAKEEEQEAQVPDHDALAHVKPALKHNIPNQSKINDLAARLRKEKEAKDTEEETITHGTSTKPSTGTVVKPPTAESPADKLARLRAKLGTAANPAGSKEESKEDSKVSAPKEAKEAAEVSAKLVGHTYDRYGNEIKYNEKQTEFVDLVRSGESCVLIGAAGTGKTTSVQGALQELILEGKVGTLSISDHKHLNSGGPGIVTISYTRRAVNNIKRSLPEDLKNNCITAHKLIEYAPEFYEDQDPITGVTKKTMQFVPSRHYANPLPDSLQALVIEEASMMSVELFLEILDALPHKMQFIFLGDIQQLPPVFGSAILGYKLLELPVVELTEVYRQALESPIIKLAHRILSGVPIEKEELPKWETPGQLKLHPWAKRIKDEDALLTLAAFFKKAERDGVYDPEEDIILIPYNKACGTIELNKHIANHLAKKRGATTYEVMAGFEKLYFSPGDKVLHEKEDAEILEISPNAGYLGSAVQMESKNLDYWGYNPKLAQERHGYGEDMDVDAMLDSFDGPSDERVRQGSHSVTVRLLDSGNVVTVSGAGELNAMIHAYALTIHKSQGSEWRKVFLMLHHSHAKMIQRELLYTACTRAKEELFCLCEPDSFVKGILSQKIKGNTLEEKAEFFKGKFDEYAQKLDMIAKGDKPNKELEVLTKQLEKTTGFGG